MSMYAAVLPMDLEGLFKNLYLLLSIVICCLKKIKRELDALEQEMVHQIFEKDADFKAKTLQQARNSSLFYSDINKSNEMYFEQNPLFKAAVFNIVKETNKKDNTCSCCGNSCHPHNTSTSAGLAQYLSLFPTRTTTT